MVLTILGSIARDDPYRASRVGETINLSPSQPCDLADASACQERKPKPEPNPASSRRFDNPIPKQPNFTVRQDSAADILDTALFEPMARVGFDYGRIHSEGENTADERMNPVRQRRLTVRDQTLEQLNDVAALDCRKTPALPFRENVLPQISFVSCAAAFPAA